MGWAKRQNGFTIVELLIVVVVIAILAAITIVSYNGITNRAKDSSVEADVASAVKKLEAAKITSSASQYPASLSVAGVAASGSNSLYYQNFTNDNSYCVEGTNGSSAWYASSVSTTPSVGHCGADSLIGHWNFNGNTNDTSGNGLNGTISGSIVLATGQGGKANGAYSFPGSAAYMTFGNSTKFNTPELTMSIWANPDQVTAGYQTLMARELQQKYRFITAAGFGALSTTTGGNWTHQPTCSYATAAGQWYHVVYTISAASGRMKLYVNGAQICDNPGPAITGYATTDLYVGSYNTAGTEGFDGLLDDARFYNRALTSAEIKSLYDQGAE